MKKTRDGISGGVFYLGLAVIGVLAIPAASLVAVRHYRMRAQKGGENA